MPTDARKSFVADMALRHGRRLRRYLAARLKNATDVADLSQEVYLRLLRVDRVDKIRRPESYLFTIASHVLHQHALSRQATPQTLDVMDALIDSDLSLDPDPGAQLDLQLRMKAVNSALEQLPPSVHASILLHCRDGWTLEEIGTRLGVSRSMVKKHLAKAMLHCRENMEREG